MSDFPNLTSYGYHLEQEIGHNRSGGRVTYLANDIENPQLVVIKQFQFAQFGSTWSGYQSYEQEIKLLQHLDHPSIPRYLNSFETSTGFCLVQEYKRAPTLARRQCWTLAEIKLLAVEILKVLVYLQQQTPPIFHRDIKPENILVDRQRGFKVYLVDFGFAHIGSSELAISSVVKGTMGFMPPEQLFHRQLSEASDLYSLGVTLICLLTGTASANVGQLMEDNYSFNFQRLPKQSHPITDWLAKMVAPKVIQRYPNAQAALTALQQVDVAKRGVSTFRRSVQPDSVKPVHLAIVLATAIATAIILWKSMLPSTSNQASYSEVVNQGNVLFTSEQYEGAIDIYDRAIQMNNKRIDAWVNKGAALERLKLYDEALAAFDTALQDGMERGVFPLEQAWLNKAVTLTRVRRYDEAIAAYTKALELNPYFTPAQKERENLIQWMQRP